MLPKVALSVDGTCICISFVINISTSVYLFRIIGKLKAYLEMGIRRSYSTSKVMLKFTTNYGTVIVVGGEGL